MSRRMNARFPLSALAAILALSSSATAQSTEAAKSEYGLAFGIRSGYAIPFASAYSNSKLSDNIQGMIPIWLDAGFRFSPYVYLGAFFQYGFGILPSNANCSGGVSCSESDVRLGINVHYHFLPSGRVDPWLGIGTGYEWLNASVSGTGGSASGSLRGWEFANVQLGTDFTLSRIAAVGPFVGLTIAEYTTSEVTSGAVSVSAEIPNKTVHLWLMFGVRGQFNINFN